MTDASRAPQAELRLDVWLWRARFYKSRALATRTVKDGKIRLERYGQTIRAYKPKTILRPSDRLTFMRGEDLFHIEVLAIGTRRGPASEAQTLYQIVETAANLPLTA